MHGKALPALVIAIVAAFVLAGCGSAAAGNGGTKSSAPAPTTGGASATATGASVNIANLAFTPQTLTVRPGTTVTWTNNDAVPHDVTSTNGMAINAKKTGLFSSGLFNQGNTFSFTFTKAGTYFYECSIHFNLPAMHAKIVVK